MRRYGQVIGIKPERIAEYEALHAAVWPEVLATIHACNMRNYSIFRHGARYLCYQRGGKSGEKRLAAKRSIGIGGHINPHDQREDSLARVSTIALISAGV